MSPESSPFTPGQPAPVEFFVGRREGIERLRALVRRSLQGRLQVGFVTGERGIGKSSLVSFVRHLVEREDNVAGTHVYLGSVGDVDTLVRRLFDRLLKDSIEKPWHGRLLDAFRDRVKKVGAFGLSFELNLSPDEAHNAAVDFGAALRHVMGKIGQDRKGLLIILDDINGLAESTEFAHWMKSTVDSIATSSKPVPVTLIVVGLEERRQSLIDRQPSLARVFELTPIQAWDDDEAAQFFRSSFESGSVKIDPQALRFMVMYSGGLPVLAHEIGDAVWRVATRPAVDERAAAQGVYQAAEVIGHKFLKPQVYEAIRSERYRSILRKLSDRSPSLALRRADVLARLDPPERRVLDNFLRRMKTLGAIIPDPEGGPGAYRFPNRLHALYFWIESQRDRRPV